MEDIWVGDGRRVTPRTTLSSLLLQSSAMILLRLNEAAMMHCVCPSRSILSPDHRTIRDSGMSLKPRFGHNIGSHKATISIREAWARSKTWHTVCGWVGVI